MFYTKVVDKIKTYISCSQTFYPKTVPSVRQANIEKCGGDTRQQMTSQYDAYAFHAG